MIPKSGARFSDKIMRKQNSHSGGARSAIDKDGREVELFAHTVIRQGATS
jgi:hypothetical protein